MAKENRDKNKKNIKYRFVVIDDNTHKNLFVFKATKLTIISVSILSLILFIAIIYVAICYTPIREYIPGYPSAKTKREYIQNSIKVDSLERELQIWSFYLSNIHDILMGKETALIEPQTNRGYPEEMKAFASRISREDSLLRNQVRQEERISLDPSTKSRISQLEGTLFFTPIKGIISQGYNPGTGHPFVDIAATTNSTVYSTLDGTIISAMWNDETGYTIQIQHDNDLISVYKHNVKLLKRAGDRVTAGTPIALIGDAGRLSTGPHLHFELWHKGVPIDPTRYIKF